MSIKKQIKKELQKELRSIERYELKHRSAFARAGLLLLTAATVFSLTGLGHDQSRQRAMAKEAVIQLVPVFNPAEKNETVRMPIKFDEGNRAMSNGGE